MTAAERKAADEFRGGEGAWSDIIQAGDTAGCIAGLSDWQLRCLLKRLADRNECDGIPGQIWAMAIGEAAKRFTQRA